MHRDGPRPAVVGFCSHALAGGDMPLAERVQALLAANLAMIDQMAQKAAAQGRPLDIAVLPEHDITGISEDVSEIAEDVDGPLVTAMAAKAREHSAHVACPVHLRRDGRVFNCLVMLDRAGEVLGVYDKAFPVTWSDGTLERGVTPGCRFPVFDLDVGRVGLQICWDIAFPEGWRALGEQGAELVLYATDPIGMLGVRAHAWEHEYWIAGSTYSPPAAVVDPTGHVVATTSAKGEAQVVRIDLDYRVLNTNCLWGFPETEQRKYADQIRFEFHQEEYLWLVSSLDPALPVGQFLKDHGLVSGGERRAHNLDLIAKERPASLEA
jgi:predicted amidohydrolase